MRSLQRRAVSAGFVIQIYMHRERKRPIFHGIQIRIYTDQQPRRRAAVMLTIYRFVECFVYLAYTYIHAQVLTKKRSVYSRSFYMRFFFGRRCVVLARRLQQHVFCNTAAAAVKSATPNLFGGERRFRFKLVRHHSCCSTTAILLLLHYFQSSRYNHLQQL